jgi:uncharacterized protein YbaA (DUF1428 family)
MPPEPLYRATFTTPEHWTVELRGESGVEAQSFLIAEGRAEGRLSARLRAANFPRRRTDGTLTPDFRGVLETDDGATILFAWHGYGRAGRLTGSITHLSADPRYDWLNDRVCTVVGRVHERAAGGFEVVIEVAELAPDE